MKKQKIDSPTKKEASFSSDEIAFDATALIASSIISAYTAVEAFCNDSIPERSDKEGIERHFSTTSKLTEVLPEIFDVGSPKGKNPVWKSYKALKDARDGLIHAKSKNTRSVGLEDRNLWDQIFTIQKPHSLAKDVFDWFLKKEDTVPMWYTKYPK